MSTLAGSKSVICHRILPRTTSGRSITTRNLGTSAAKILGNVNVDNILPGVTTEMAKNDPVLADYIRSNFPELFETEQDIAKRGVTNWGELRRSAPKPSLNIRSLATLKRCPDTEEGSNQCFPMRDHGFIPGIIYGGDPTQGIKGGDYSKRIFVKTPTPLIQSELDRYRHAFDSRVYDLTLYENEEQWKSKQGGIVHRVLPRDIQKHPVSDAVYCCNFLRYFPGRPVKIPLTLINEEESPALKRDGYLIPINRFVECTIEEGVAIPEELEVECTGLQFKDVVRLNRINFPEGVQPSKKVVKRKDWMVGPIHGGKAGSSDDSAEG